MMGKLSRGAREVMVMGLEAQSDCKMAHDKCPLYMYHRHISSNNWLIMLRDENMMNLFFI